MKPLSLPATAEFSAPPGEPGPLWRLDVWRASLAALLVTAFFWLHNAAVALPEPVSPEGGEGDSDFIGAFGGFAFSAIEAIVLIVGALIFVVVAWLLIEALVNATSGRGSFATVIFLGIIAAGVLVFDLFILNQATEITAGGIDAAGS